MLLNPNEKLLAVRTRVLEPAILLIRLTRRAPKLRPRSCFPALLPDDRLLLVLETVHVLDSLLAILEDACDFAAGEQFGVAGGLGVLEDDVDGVWLLHRLASWCCLVAGEAVGHDYSAGVVVHVVELDVADVQCGRYWGGGSHEVDLFL